MPFYIPFVLKIRAVAVVHSKGNLAYFLLLKMNFDSIKYALLCLLLYVMTIN